MSSKRLAADLVEVQKPLYQESGIYYSFDEANMQKGYACIFGPKGTPYEDCPMLYEFTIGNTFPFDPPHVMFRTQDRCTRFHPNMYVEGKVCLSILHTWEGPKWASTMRLSTILVTLQSIMDEYPLRHEPGWERAPESQQKLYARAVEHACMNYILQRALSFLEKKQQPTVFQPFEETFAEKLPGILERLETRLTEATSKGELNFTGLPYGMIGNTQYAVLLNRCKALREMLP